MGTNYYAKLNECKHCNRYEEVHLGKSSMGWVFTFNLNGEKFYHDVPSMKQWLKGKNIKNEYGECITEKKFWNMVKEKQSEKHQAIGEHIGGFEFLNHEFS